MSRRRGVNIGRNTPDRSEEEIPVEPIINAVDDTEETHDGPAGNTSNTDQIIPFSVTDSISEEVSEDEAETDIFPDDAYFDPNKNNAAVQIDRDHLAAVDISQRRGNYLISVGLPSSGKTVLQSFMTYYMTISGSYSASLDNKEADGRINYEAQRLRTLWLEEWRKGQFPKGTPLRESEIRELRLEVENLENKKQSFNFSFLEISGENFKDVVPTEISDPNLFSRINGFLSNRKIKLNIAFVLKTDETPGEPTNDALFTNFLSFVENQLSIDVTNKIGLVLVIPNPKFVFGESDWQRMRSASSVDRKFYDRCVKSYIYENFPATYTIYNRWNKNKRKITIFHIGDEVNGQLTNMDYADVKAFIKLNYNLFTGKTLEKRRSLVKKLLGLSAK